MKALEKFDFDYSPPTGLHRHEAYLLKLLVLRRLVIARKWLWLRFRDVARPTAKGLAMFVRSFLLFSSGRELTRRTGPHEKPQQREQWDRYQHWGGGRQSGF